MTVAEHPPQTADGAASAQRHDAPRWYAALAGVLAAFAALAVGELAAGIIAAGRSPVEAVGAATVDLSPPALKDFAIAMFGTADKIALQVGIVVVSALLAVGLGLLARRSLGLASAGIALFGVAGIAASFANTEGANPLVAALPSMLAIVAGVAALVWLARSRGAVPAAGGSSGTDRRAFLRASATVAGAAAVTAGAGRWLKAQAGVAAARMDVVLPPPASQAPPILPTADLEIEGLAPYITPNADFYRIDTALTPPRVNPAEWSLKITGMVDRELTFSFDDLLGRDLVEKRITMACVSNEVGGGLVGNATWLGIPLARLLEEAGVQEGATQIVGRSVDDFTVGFPTETVFDGRDALLAVGMNGEPLPVEHGFPARLVVAGLYGYVSATKWLSEIELTTLDAFDAYWIPRGWAKEAPVKTQSRIDVPKPAANVSAGTVPVAGVAWAPTRGISKVEVSIDDGPWQETRLSEDDNIDTWRQWVYEWQAEPGVHRIQVRATDGTGELQREIRRPPRPDGATGWHQVLVTVA